MPQDGKKDAHLRDCIATSFQNTLSMCLFICYYFNNSPIILPPPLATIEQKWPANRKNVYLLKKTCSWMVALLYCLCSSSSFLTRLMLGRSILLTPPSLTLILRQRLESVCGVVLLMFFACTHWVAKPKQMSPTRLTSADKWEQRDKSNEQFFWLSYFSPEEHFHGALTWIK